ncbi:MAG TPA: hypothetical protein PLA90_18740, partial [Candidatus Sumerlaeota bacterium]|nr:hypothetical protein [Candidatus Sumerlaeota bacterium]
LGLTIWMDIRIVRRVWRAVSQPMAGTGSDQAVLKRKGYVSALPDGNWRPVVVASVWHAILLVFVWCLYAFAIPACVSIYMESGREIPCLTRQILNGSRPPFLIFSALLLFPSLVALDFFISWFAQNKGGRKWLRGWSIAYVLAMVSFAALTVFALSLPFRLAPASTTSKSTDPLSPSEQQYQEGIGPDVAFFQGSIGESHVGLKGRALAGTRLAFYLGDNSKDGWSCTLPNATSRFSVTIEKRENNKLDCRVLDEITQTEIFSKDSIETLGEVSLSQGTLAFSDNSRGIVPPRRFGMDIRKVGEWTSPSGEERPVFISLTPPTAYIPSPGHAGSTPAPEEPAPDPALVEQKPELRFLVWRGQDSNRREGELDGAWRPDGSPVDVNGEDRKLLGEISHGSIGDATDPARYFLYLGLKHPLLDSDSIAEMQILDATGQPLKLGPHSGALVYPVTGGGWITCILSEDDNAKWPSQVNLRLRYTIRPWKEEVTIPSDYNTSDNRMLSYLPHGLSVTSVGQDTEGDAFIAVTRDLTVDPDIQCGFVAVTRDG